MDLQHPLRSLVPSLDWAVLEVLAASHAGLGASQIARLSARGTRVGQVPILDRLVEHGLVEAEPANRGFLYRLNRAHVLAPAILLAANSRAELLDRLRRAIEDFEPQPVHASVFGSFARGDAGTSSDIDVLLVANGADGVSSWASALDALRASVHAWTGNRCQCLAFDVAHVAGLARAKEPIVARWLADGVTIGGAPLGTLLVRADRQADARRRGR